MSRSNKMRPVQDATVPFVKVPGSKKVLEVDFAAAFTDHGALAGTADFDDCVLPHDNCAVRTAFQATFGTLVQFEIRSGWRRKGEERVAPADESTTAERSHQQREELGSVHDSLLVAVTKTVTASEPRYRIRTREKSSQAERAAESLVAL